MSGGIAILLVTVVLLLAGGVALALYGSGALGLHDASEAGRREERG